MSGKLYIEILRKSHNTINGEIEYGIRPSKPNLPFSSLEYKDVKQILDEAKKDFPVLHIEDVGSFFITTNSYEKAVADWFIKWFGEQP